MEFYFFEVIVTWMSCKAIKGIWTQVKRRISYMVGKSQDNQGVVDLNASESRRWKYDVFLSFRGPDTRKGITTQIRDRLHRSGIITFMDEPDLRVGDTISPTLIKAIKKSRFAIVILSQNYASSAWCLEELREICLSMEDNRILPIFYHVDPTDVRYQKRSFEEAFSYHETSQRHESEKVNQWRAALSKVANISGWNTNDFKTHSELVDKIVEFLRSKVPPDAIEFTDDFQAFGATKEATDKVMKALTDDEITAVGVYGMGGVGKTSMVRHVAAQACRNGTFNHWIMAVVSQNLDLKKIQGTLADLLGFKFVEETEDGRAARLHNEIMKKEKLLIIVDDVWERTELSKIGIPTYNELQKCKSKVLLTTRRLNVCNAMKCHEKISLKVLSDQDSWTLFVRNAGTISFESTSFEEVARKVAGECKGLPIALKAVARALKDEDQEEWEKAAKRLEQSQYINPNYEEDEENAFRCIRLSYDYLKNEDHKSCFLLCCMFPEDHEIEIEHLFRYTIGKRLFRDAETMEVARGRLVTVVKYLKGSSLLLDSQKKGCVKMHDVIRDTALNIAQSEEGHWFFVKAGVGLKGWPPRGLHEGCTVVSLMRNEIRKLPEEELVCPNLQILLLNGNYELSKIPEKLIQNLKELRVLDLSNTSISVLPKSFSLLTNLQALYLDDCRKLIDISVVGKLKKLEILSMRGCPRGELSREVGYLNNLRILDVNRYGENGIVTIPSKVIPKLHKLEEMYMVYCGFEDGVCVPEGPREGANIIRFDELAGLSNLKILQVGLSDESFIPKNVKAAPDWDYFYISIIGRCTSSIYSPSIYGPAAYEQGDCNSRSLFLNGATISTLPDWFIKAVTERTEKLEYKCCGGMSDIVMEYDHGRLHKLKHLTVAGYFLDSYVYLKELMNTTRRVETGPVLENLEELHLIYLIHLEELCVGELPPGSLFNLKVFHVYFGMILRSVSEFVQRLPNLEKLDLNCMYELEYVFRCDGFEPEQAKLREMHLLCLQALRSICNGPAPHAMFQCLKILTIYRCELLQSLFASDVAECLVQLEDLLVERCPLLERVMEAVNNEKTVLPKLKNLVLKNLPILYGPSATTVDIKCPSLEHLIVVDCAHIPFSITYSLFRSFGSRSRLSFSTSASDYFGSTYPVQLNDLRLYKLLRGRKVPLDPIESRGNFQVYEATKEAMRKVMEALMDDKITAVGVHGIVGVGKTSMVRHVAAQSCKNGTFHRWIMAFVSQDLDLKKIQGTLADKLGFKFVEETEDGRADRLHKEIIGKEKLLIILDDVWDEIELSKIGIPDYKELQTRNSKVLLSTRRLSVCNAMECHEKIALKLLSEKDSWNLFLRNAGTISFQSTSFTEVARKVAGKCKGLPLALKVVARALRDKDQEKWEKAAKILEQSQCGDIIYLVNSFS